MLLLIRYALIRSMSHDTNECRSKLNWISLARSREGNQRVGNIGTPSSEKEKQTKRVAPTQHDRQGMGPKRSGGKIAARRVAEGMCPVRGGTFSTVRVVVEKVFSDAYLPFLQTVATIQFMCDRSRTQVNCQGYAKRGQRTSISGSFSHESGGRAKAFRFFGT